MSNHKKEIRHLMTNGQLQEATTAALTYAEACGIAASVNVLSVLQSNLEVHRHLWGTGQISYEEFSREHARATQHLLDCLEELPEIPAPESAKQRLTDETVFKHRLFWMLVAAKTTVFLWTYYLWQTGGFQNEEALTAFSVLAPTFVAYISLMIADYLRTHREQVKSRRRYVSGMLTRLAFWLFPIYALAQIIIIGKKPSGDLSFAQMNAALAIVESILGGYVGQIVQAFFKKEE
jgi:Effector-associated domain 11